MSVKPLVAVLMGSQSDWETMQYTATVLKILDISFHYQVISAHRTPDLLSEFSKSALDQGFRLIIAGAGGAAHLPGMIAANTTLPVVGVPITSHALHGMDSLLSIVQMPAGVPVATMAIGIAGAKNAALLAASVLSLSDTKVLNALLAYRKAQTESVLHDCTLPDAS